MNLSRDAYSLNRGEARYSVAPAASKSAKTHATTGGAFPCGGVCSPLEFLSRSMRLFLDTTTTLLLPASRHRPGNRQQATNLTSLQRFLTIALKGNVHKIIRTFASISEPII
jgi:hypothetical protein